MAVSATVARVSADHLGTGAMMLDDVDALKARLAVRSPPNFMRVIRDVAARSGFDAVDYLGLLHMKRSAHVAVLAELGLGEEASVYLEDYGHLGHHLLSGARGGAGAAAGGSSGGEPAGRWTP